MILALPNCLRVFWPQWEPCCCLQSNLPHLALLAEMHCRSSHMLPTDELRDFVVRENNGANLLPFGGLFLPWCWPLCLISSFTKKRWFWSTVQMSSVRCLSLVLCNNLVGSHQWLTILSAAARSTNTAPVIKPYFSKNIFNMLCKIEQLPRAWFPGTKSSLIWD